MNTDHDSHVLAFHEWLRDDGGIGALEWQQSCERMNAAQAVWIDNGCCNDRQKAFGED